jgi:Fungal specific transcription factor domain/Fungal Zn(2)-Cys(6) binuclear cluster domain
MHVEYWPASMFVSDIVGGNDADPFAMEGITPSSIPTPSTSTGASSAGMSKDEILFRSMALHGSSAGSRTPRTLAPNLTRRSHRKSRAGCFTCKSRKIKCGEQKPKCGNCLLKGLNCVYPVVEAPRRKESVPLHIAKRSPSGISPGTAAFTMLDMRFFHHFLTTAYPHLPIGNDHVWVNEIPQFAESHEYLMHAILSLGASHLSRLTGVDYRKESLTHRGQALAGLNQALSQPAQNYGESDAMLAACYALTFQASYMGDGLSDFITMVRGCALTTGKIREENAVTAFNLEPDWHFKVMAPRLSNLPRVNRSLLEEGFEAMENLRPYLVGETDIDFHEALVNVIGSLLKSPQGGYLQFVGVYAVW